jgi:glycosyltransferase involved in cell wall biosynthesis
VFLFVGTLDYYPNRDAVAYFCRDVAPLVRARTTRRFEIRVVSASGDGRRRSVPDVTELSWAPRDADLGREYDRADAAIVPTRAGGGTRIKALEAFAHRRPVVATGIGVEGLDVRDGEHALIGNTADELAAHAVALMDDAALRRRLVDRAFALVRTAYGPAALRRRFDDVHEARMTRPA